MNTLIQINGELPITTITPDAFKVKELTLKSAAAVTSVGDMTAYNFAKLQRDSLKSLLKMIEDSRKQASEPYLAAQRDIMAKAKSFVADIEAEAERIKSLMEVFAEQQEKIRQAEQRKLQAEQEALAKAQREAEDKARREEQARLAAQEAAVRAGEESGRRSAMAARKAAAALEQARAEAAAAEQARLEAEAEQQKQALAVVHAKAAGSSMKLDYNITDLMVAVNANPELFKIEPRRQEILFRLNRGAVLPGIETFRAINVR